MLTSIIFSKSNSEKGGASTLLMVAVLSMVVVTMLTSVYIYLDNRAKLLGRMNKSYDMTYVMDDLARAVRTAYDMNLPNPGTCPAGYTPGFLDCVQMCLRTAAQVETALGVPQANVPFNASGGRGVCVVDENNANQVYCAFNTDNNGTAEPSYCAGIVSNTPSSEETLYANLDATNTINELAQISIGKSIENKIVETIPKIAQNFYPFLETKIKNPLPLMEEARADIGACVYSELTFTWNMSCTDDDNDGSCAFTGYCSIGNCANSGAATCVGTTLRQNKICPGGAWCGPSYSIYNTPTSFNGGANGTNVCPAADSLNHPSCMGTCTNAGGQTCSGGFLVQPRTCTGSGSCVDANNGNAIVANGSACSSINSGSACGACINSGTPTCNGTNSVQARTCPTGGSSCSDSLNSNATVTAGGTCVDQVLGSCGTCANSGSPACAKPTASTAPFNNPSSFGYSFGQILQARICSGGPCQDSLNSNAQVASGANCKPSATGSCSGSWQNVGVSTNCDMDTLFYDYLVECRTSGGSPDAYCAFGASADPADSTTACVGTCESVPGTAQCLNGVSDPSPLPPFSLGTMVQDTSCKINGVTVADSYCSSGCPYANLGSCNAACELDPTSNIVCGEEPPYAGSLVQGLRCPAGEWYCSTGCVGQVPTDDPAVSCNGACVDTGSPACLQDGDSYTTIMPQVCAGGYCAPGSCDTPRVLGGDCTPASVCENQPEGPSCINYCQNAGAGTPLCGSLVQAQDAAITLRRIATGDPRLESSTGDIRDGFLDTTNGRTVASVRLAVCPPWRPATCNEADKIVQFIKLK